MAKKDKGRRGSPRPQEVEKIKWDFIENDVVVIEREIKILCLDLIKNIHDIGLRLDKLKKHLSHGEYKRTIEKKFLFSYSSALNYRNVGVNFDSAEEAALFDCRTLYEIAKPSVTPELRRVIIDDAKRGGKWNVKKVKEALGQVKKITEHSSEEDCPSDTTEASVSPFVYAVKSVKDMISTAVLFTNGLEWPEEPTVEEHQLMDSILPELKVLVQAFRAAPKKSNRCTF